jgi:sarcosine oxidase
MMRSTYPQWRSLERRSGRSLIAMHGGLHLGSRADIDVVRQGILDAGEKVEDADTSRFGVEIGNEAALYEPTAGVMDPPLVRVALAEVARASGAELRTGLAVREIRDDHGRQAIRTDNGLESFDRVILAGGPWAFRLMPHLAESFEITRRFQVVFRTDEPLGDGAPRPWIDHAAPGFYGMINVAPGTHVIGLHELGDEQLTRDPDEPDDASAREASVEEQIAYVVGRFDMDHRPEIVEVRTCHYTSTASRDFVVDAVPDAPGVILLSACSGHGFKFTISTGDLAARAALGEAPPDRFRLP